MLQIITVTPAAVSVLVGADQQYAATGAYSDDSVQDLTASVQWSIVGNAGVAQVAPGPGGGNLTCLAPGSVSVAAQSGNVSGSTSVNCYQIE